MSNSIPPLVYQATAPAARIATVRPDPIAALPAFERIAAVHHLRMVLVRFLALDWEAEAREVAETEEDVARIAAAYRVIAPHLATELARRIARYEMGR